MKMNKLFISLLAAFTVYSASAASVSIVLQPAGYTNIPTIGKGSLILRQILASANSNTVTVAAYDAPSTNFSYVTPAYTNYSYYATNQLVWWTNYYGVSNSFTQLALIDTSNSVAAATNAWPVRLSINAGTNTATFNGSWYFVEGVLLTNSSSSVATLTFSYTQ